MSERVLPRLLVVDDEFGREIAGRVNRDRERICSVLGLVDLSSEHPGRGVKRDEAIAEAVFIRGQLPVMARVGERVQNDLEGVVEKIHWGWDGRPPGEPPWALVLLDLAFCTGLVTEESDAAQPGMPEGAGRDGGSSEYFGLDILGRIRTRFPDLPVAILSSQSRGPIDRQIDRLGHCGFIAKTDPGSADYLRGLIWRHGLFPDQSGAIVGNSTVLLSALREARRLSDASRNVLLLGERGTGKELFARFIHGASPRCSGPLVTVDCGALSEDLFESELFGHVKGAFTGANRSKKGSITSADGGHLFLDEVGNMPERVQRGLLRVIDDGRVVPVGAESPAGTTPVDVRFLSATNEDLEGRTLTGTFKSDLLDRLRRGGSVSLPPLRSRVEDIPVLAQYFLEQARTATPHCSVEAIAPEAIEVLCQRRWPGNVRELEDCLAQAVFRHRDVRTIFPSQFDLPPDSRVAGGNSKIAAPSLASATPREGSSTGRDIGRSRVNEEQIAALQIDEIHGFLPDLRREYARTAARLLEQALRLTVNLDGSFNFTRAVDRLRGSKRTTTEAADEIKRILRFEPTSVSDLVLRTPLREALEWALSTRPTAAGRRRGDALTRPRRPPRRRQS